MSKFESFKEGLGIFILVVILVGFFGGFGYIVKKELIDKESILSSIVNKKDNEKKEAINNSVTNGDSEKDVNDSNPEIVESTNEGIKEDEKVKKEENVDNTSISSEIDTKEYKSYPSVLCTISKNLDDTEIVYTESYNAFFDTDGTMSWVKYSYKFDFSDHVDAYNELYKEGYFDDIYELYSEIGNIALNEKSFSVTYEVKKDVFLKLDNDLFKSEKDLTYDLFSKKLDTKGYTCKDE